MSEAFALRLTSAETYGNYSLFSIFNILMAYELCGIEQFKAFFQQYVHLHFFTLLHLLIFLHLHDKLLSSALTEQLVTLTTLDVRDTNSN